MLIKNIEVKTPLVLAPMAGITDLPFRVICKEFGADLTVSEMVSAKGLIYKNLKTFDMLKIEQAERPTAIQLFGSVPEELAQAAKIVEKSGADIIDFNMGCPVPKVVNNGEGSALMKNPQLAYDILARMVDAVKIPVSVKIRIGWDKNTINAVEIARLAEKAGVDFIAVHGRTREQFYSGRADWTAIKDVKDSVKIPVIGNGDIFSIVDAQKMLAETGCDGLMLGRGIDGNPWLFKQIKAELNKKEIIDISLEERLSVAERHLKMLIDFKGETVAVKEMRRHIGAYLKGLPNAAEYRSRFHKMNTFEEFHFLLNDYLKNH